MVGLLILLASTLLMWLATPMALQVLSRVGQGAADAMLYVVGMTIILDTVSVKHIAEYMGHVAIAMNVGTFAGPLLGGVVFDRAGYHAMWWMMLGFVILDALLRYVMVEKTKVSRAEDVAGQSESDLDQELTRDIHDQDVDLSGVKAAPSADGMQLIRISTYTAVNQSSPLGGAMKRDRLPAIVTLLASMRMDVALYGVCVQAMIFSGFETVVSLYVQDIWDYSSLGAGLIFIPLTVPAFFAPLLGRIVDRTSPRRVLVTGFLGLCPVLVATQYVRHNGIGQKVLMCALLVMIGLGITIALTPLMAEISYVVDDLEKREPRRYRRKASHGGGAYAQAYALFAMAWSVGNIGGPLLCGLIKDEAGWASMCVALAVLSGTTALPCFIWSGEGLQGWPFRSDN